MKCKLKDIADLITKGSTPRGEDKYSDSDVVFLRAENITNKIELSNNKKYITKQTHLIDLKRSVLEENDVLITIAGSLGRTGIVTSNILPANINQAVALIRLKKDQNAKFIYFYLKQKNLINTLIASSAQSVQPNLNLQQIGDIEIELPDNKTQDKIAYLLSIIDEKIDNNNNINKNLEEQAYAIISSKILNINNKNMKTLDEFCNIFTGKKNANKSVINGKYKFFTCAPEVLNIDSYIYDGSAIIISGNGAYTGRTTFYKGKFDLYQRTYACTIKENVNCEYIYLLYWLVKSTLSKNISGGTHGSAIPYIVMDDIAKFEFSYDKNIFDNLLLILKSNLEKILNNNNENEKLVKLRDSLLPKLMSGEIDVSKIDI